MHASEAPVLLGRVCSLWRRISLNTNELWAKLHIVVPTVNYPNTLSSLPAFRRKRQLVKIWLGRSGTCPLSISMVWFAGRTEDEMRLCSIILELLRPLSRRWKSLDLQIPLDMLVPFKDLTPVDVPLLQSISLVDNYGPEETGVRMPWSENLNFVTIAPSRRHFSPAYANTHSSALELSEIEDLPNQRELQLPYERPFLPLLCSFSLSFYSGSITLPCLPLHQLTNLLLEANVMFFFPDSPTMLSILRECISLRELTLKFPLSQSPGTPIWGQNAGDASGILSYAATHKAMQQIKSIGEGKGGILRLKHLESLSIDGDQHLHNTFHMSNLLEFIIVPKLKKLKLLGRSGTCSFVEEEDETVNDSSATRKPIPPDPMTSVLVMLRQSNFPPVEKLSLESIGFIDPFPSSPTEANSTTPLGMQSPSGAVSPYTFIKCLRLMPMLKGLLVHNWPGHDYYHHRHHHTEPVDNAAVEDENVGVNDDDDDDDLVYTTSSSRSRHPAALIAENIVLKALTLPKKYRSTLEDTCVNLDSGADVDAALESGSEEDIICPNLTYLDFVFDFKSSHDLLGAFIESRCSLPSSWESSPISSSSPLSKHVSPSFQLENEPDKSKDKSTSVARLKCLKATITAPISKAETNKLQALVDKYKSKSLAPEDDYENTELGGSSSYSGLDASLSFQPMIGCCDDVSPSPWTGLADDSL